MFEIRDGLPSDCPSFHAHVSIVDLEAFRAENADVLTDPIVGFVDRYLTNGYDMLTAARVVKAPAPNASDRERKAWATAVLSHSVVKEWVALRHRVAYFSKRVSKERLISELEAIGTANLSDFVTLDWAGNPQISFDPDNRAKMAAVAKVKTKTRRDGDDATIEEVSLDFHDKIAALKELLRRADAEDAATSTPGIGQTFANPETPPVPAVAPRVVFNIVPVPSGQFFPAPPSPYVTPSDDDDE